ncbi:unnamed protein product [Periconia digitata]|uniref:Uncharacterized protein n=1 Tax=Periconia digitata TaxID=1303443 RepID=A0A9W4XF51_9PLEO|nr:unnamed protein product [Periconia digitata]
MTGSCLIDRMFLRGAEVCDQGTTRARLQKSVLWHCNSHYPVNRILSPLGLNSRVKKDLSSAVVFGD